MQKSVIGRGRGGANRGLGRGGRGATRGKSANNKPANVPLKETEFLAPLFHDKERGRVRNMKATPKDVNFDAGKIVGRPHGNWQGQYSLVTVPDGRPREVAAKNHFTPLISVVDGSANMIIFLVMAYDKPTDATTMKETSSGDHMQMLLDKSRNSLIYGQNISDCGQFGLFNPEHWPDDVHYFKNADFHTPTVKFREFPLILHLLGGIGCATFSRMSGFKHKVEKHGIQYSPPPEPEDGPRSRRRNDEDLGLLSNEEAVAPMKPASMIQPPSQKERPDGPSKPVDSTSSVDPPPPASKKPKTDPAPTISPALTSVADSGSPVSSGSFSDRSANPGSESSSAASHTTHPPYKPHPYVANAQLKYHCPQFLQEINYYRQTKFLPLLISASSEAEWAMIQNGGPLLPYQLVHELNEYRTEWKHSLLVPLPTQTTTTPFRPLPTYPNARHVEQGQQQHQYDQQLKHQHDQQHHQQQQLMLQPQQQQLHIQQHQFFNSNPQQLPFQQQPQYERHQEPLVQNVQQETTVEMNPAYSNNFPHATMWSSSNSNTGCGSTQPAGYSGFDFISAVCPPTNDSQSVAIATSSVRSPELDTGNVSPSRPTGSASSSPVIPSDYEEEESFARDEDAMRFKDTWSPPDDSPIFDNKVMKRHAFLQSLHEGGMENIYIGAFNQMYLLGMMNSANVRSQEQNASSGSSDNPSSSSADNETLDAKYGAFHFLKNLPIKLPIRSKQEVIDAHGKLYDKNVMEEMAEALVQVVQTAKRLEEGRGKRKDLNVNSLLCNAIMSRFELPYFVTKADMQPQKLAPWFVDKLDRLPLGRCFHLKEMYERAVVKLGHEKLIAKRGDESQFVTWLRQRRQDINARLGIPKTGAFREHSIPNERARSLVQEYADGIMNDLPLEIYFRYTNVCDVISAVPAPFRLRYNVDGGALPGSEAGNGAHEENSNLENGDGEEHSEAAN